MKKDISFKERFKALSQKKIFALICLYIAMVVIFTVWAELRHTHFLTVAVFTISPLLYEVLHRIPFVRWCVFGEKKTDKK